MATNSKISQTIAAMKAEMGWDDDLGGFMGGFGAQKMHTDDLPTIRIKEGKASMEPMTDDYLVRTEQYLPVQVMSGMPYQIASMTTPDDMVLYDSGATLQTVSKKEIMETEDDEEDVPKKKKKKKLKDEIRSADFEEKRKKASKIFKKYFKKFYQKKLIAMYAGRVEDLVDHILEEFECWQRGGGRPATKEEVDEYFEQMRLGNKNFECYPEEYQTVTTKHGAKEIRSGNLVFKPIDQYDDSPNSKFDIADSQWEQYRKFIKGRKIKTFRDVWDARQEFKATLKKNHKRHQKQLMAFDPMYRADMMNIKRMKKNAKGLMERNALRAQHFEEMMSILVGDPAKKKQLIEKFKDKTLRKGVPKIVCEEVDRMEKRGYSIVDQFDYK